MLALAMAALPVAVAARQDWGYAAVEGWTWCVSPPGVVAMEQRYCWGRTDWSQRRCRSSHSLLARLRAAQAERDWGSVQAAGKVLSVREGQGQG